MRFSLILLSAVILQACIVVPAAQRSRPNKEAENKPEVRPYEVLANVLPRQPKTIVQVGAACDSIHESSDIPVECGIGQRGDTLSMTFNFANAQVASQWQGAVNDRLGGPYCDIAKRNSRPAVLAITLQQENDGRLFSCQKDRFVKKIKVHRTLPGNAALILRKK